MVAIVSGNSLGLNLTSLATLGPQGMGGQAAQGRSGASAYVNVANGNLVLQTQDELLVARGLDVAALRTYNSQGRLDDDNGDNWTSGFFLQPLVVNGTLAGAGSTIQRTDRDGSVSLYAYDAAHGGYVSTDGAGAYDTVTWLGGEAQLEWRDGSTGVTERYQSVSGAWRLLARRDPSGNALAYGYDAAGRLQCVTTAAGEATWYDYAGANLTQIRTVTADGATSTRVHYGYDASNRLATVTVDLTPGDNDVSDGKVYRTTYTYDGASKRVASVTQSDGTSLAITYVDLGGGDFGVATLRDALGQLTSFTYAVVAGTGGSVSVTDPLGLVTRYDVDAAGRLTKITAPTVTGTTTPSTQFAYDGNGDLVATTDGQGRTISYAYDANGNQVLQRDAVGDTVTRVFDARNRLLSETVYLTPDPDGAGAAQPAASQTTRYVYESGGRNLLRFVVGAEGGITEHRYDGDGQQVASIAYRAAAYPVAGLAADAALSEQDLAAWAAGQDATRTQRVDLAYDARGQLSARTTYARVGADGTGLADGTQSVERYVYDQGGRMLQSISVRDGATTYTRDGLGRVLTSTNALGEATVTQYDDAQRRTVVTLANGLVSTSAYDAAGRMVAVLQSDGAASLGQTDYFYDADGRLRMTQDPTGVRHWWLYDAAGRKTAEVDGNGTLTESAYDGSGLLTFTATYATAVDTSRLVDAAGQPVTTLDIASIRPATQAQDQREWRAYDAAQRLTRVAHTTGPTGIVAFAENRYDGASRLTQVVEYALTQPFGSGNPAPGSIVLPGASGQDRTTRHFYDADGRVAGTLDAEGYLTVSHYDASGQLSERIAYATATSTSLRATGSLAQLTPGSSASDVREVWLRDGKGQVIGHLDGEGYLTETVHDADGNVAQTVRYANRVTAAVTPAGTLGAIRPSSSVADRATTRAYDALGRLTQETSPEGTVTRYAYDTEGHLVSTTRAADTSEGRTVLARYDLQGRLVGELSGEGAVRLTGGQTQAEVEAIWSQYGSRHAYDAAGRRVSTTGPTGATTFFYYDADGHLTHTVNALGEVRESRYDAQGRVVEQSAFSARMDTAGLAGGLVTDAFAVAVTALRSSSDVTASYSYTADGRVASSIDGLGNRTTHAYNAFGDEISATHDLGDGQVLAETYTLDQRGLRTGTVADAAGVDAVTTTTYDAFGRAVRTVDANGNVREQAFDRSGRLVTTRDPLNALRTTSYDAFDRVLTQTDALGATTRYAYDTATRTMTVTTPEGIVTTTTSNRFGQVQSVRDGKGQVTSYSYDHDGRLLQTTTPLTTADHAYDAAGRLVLEVDAGRNRVSFSYDQADRVLTRTVDPGGLNLVTRYAYDGRGQQVAVTDPNGVVTTVAYDGEGNVARRTVDAGGLALGTVYTYDARRNVLTVTSPGGSVTRYTYDALGRRTSEVVDPGGLALRRAWTYDKNGNVSSATDALGNATRYVYDAADREVYALDALGNVRQTTYDGEGRVARKVAYATPIALTGLPATPTPAQIQPLLVGQPALDAVEQRVYDRDGRLAAAVDGTGGVTAYAYDANGNVVSRVAYANRIDPAAWTPGTPLPVVADPAHDARTTTVYDALDRAIYTVDGIGAVVAQSYDGNGNVLQRTAYAKAIAVTTPATAASLAAAVAAVADAAHDASVRNTYDAAGRLVWRVDGTGAVTQQVYDRDGNVVLQVEYATPVGSGAAPTTVIGSAADRLNAMVYDAANRLVFQVDAMRAVTEQVYDAEGNVVRRTAYATPIAALPALGGSGTAGAIRAALRPDATVDRSSVYGYDAAGREVIAIDAVGSVRETVYDAAGHAVTTVARVRSVSLAGLGAAPNLDALRARVVPDANADRTSRRAYDAAGRLVYAMDATGAVTGSQYDGLGRITRSTRYGVLIAAGTASNPGAISVALQAAATQAGAIADRVESYGYNAAGQRIAVTDALNQTETYGYDALGRKLSFSNKKKAVWTYTYDAAGRMLTETSPQVALTSSTLEANGSISVATASSAVVVTTLAYDALGKLTQRIEATGRSEQRTTRYEYDAAGRQVRVIYPPVRVYDGAADALATNGASGVAARVESPSKSLEARTWYDALGNAVASIDVGGALSQKAYDLAGRVAYDIDALGYVTGYTRNAFGETTELVRNASKTSLAERAVTQAGQAATREQVQAALAGVSHAGDRRLITSYDRAGRVVRTEAPSAYVYDSSATVGSQTGLAAQTTANTYDAFGQLVQASRLRNAAGGWVTTTHYFDKAGRETATVDAMGYLTTHAYDAVGNLQTTVEYAAALGAGSWSLAGFGSPGAPAGDDREVRFTYDALDRKTGETRCRVEYSVQSDGTSQRGDLATHYQYDAVGSQVRVTDAANNSTSTFYDALGRVVAIAAPARSSTADGTSVTPLTAFQRDAYGNVTVQVEYARGAGSGAQPATPGSDDRRTSSAYDSFGHVTATTEPGGAARYTSYDAWGHAAKKWQGVTDNAGATRTVFEVDVYDAVGRLIETRTPGAATLGLDQAGTQTLVLQAAAAVSEKMEYNGFGEMTRKGTQGGRQEYFDHDDAGRLWRTNTGDGVDRISLFDALGNVTAEIRSAGVGGGNLSVLGFVNAQAADANPSMRRIDIRYDALGRVVARTEAARQEMQGGVSVQRQYTTANILQTARPAKDGLDNYYYAGQNQVALAWNNLAGLGSGDVKVTIDYETVRVDSTIDQYGNPVSNFGGTARTYTSGVLQGDAAAAGVTLTWSDQTHGNLNSPDCGIGRVTRIVVSKKDMQGAWQVVIDQAPGYGANEIDVAAPSDRDTVLTLQMRAAGSSGDTGWWTWSTAGANFGETYRFDAQGLAPGSYEYRVSVAPTGQAQRVTGTGTVTITRPPLNVISPGMGYGQGGAGVLSWVAPPADTQQAFRYRPVGSTGPWTELAVNPPTGALAFAAPPRCSVATSALAAGSYQFELLWSDPGQNVPSSHATGTFTVVAAKPAYYVQPVNLPNIKGLALATMMVGGGYVPVDDTGQLVYMGGTRVPSLQWTAANARAVRYRVAGGAYTYLPIYNDAQIQGESGPTGIQKVPISILQPGTYQFEITAGLPPTAQATCTITVYAQPAGHYQTVYVQVPVRTPVVAYNQPIFETRYATRQVPYTVWVQDAPTTVTYDENGNPIYTRHGHYETRYNTETYAYQVQIGTTPIYARDESGQIVYSTTWVPQAQQQWVQPATPPSTLVVTTPPYTPGYWVAEVPAQYGLSISTAAGSAAISTNEGGVVGQSAGVNGDARSVRPTVLQKVDRWGNVVEITDPRAAAWKTSYRYNANNQLVMQVQPDATGQASSSSPVTSLYYDALGRQLAVRDANGHVNGQVYDAGGNLVKELHADGGVVQHAYDAFGQKVRTTDAEHKVVRFVYDAAGRLVRTERGEAFVYRTDGSNNRQSLGKQLLSDTWSYDQLGRKLSQTNGNGETTLYAYDLRGNLVETKQPMGQAVRAVFDAQGYKIREVDANGAASTWTYDYFGQLSTHTDLGGARYEYKYDNARQLTLQTSTHGQSITSMYDAAGQLTRISDAVDGKVTSYVYDLSGRRVRERTVQGGVTYQDNYLSYDALGRLRDVADARVHVSMQYDKVGNRTHIATHVDYQGAAGESEATSSRYFLYDEMNRQKVVDAIDAAGSRDEKTHVITYDDNGNRTSDTYWGNKVTTVDGRVVINQGYEDGSVTYSTTPTTYTSSPGYVIENYRYDALNRLLDVQRDGTQIDLRYYDGADRVVQSGPAGNLPIPYAAIINSGLAPGDMNGSETRINRYDANGRLLHQKILASDNTAKADISWDNRESYGPSSSWHAGGYDAAGNSRGYVLVNHAAGITNRYDELAPARYEGYLAAGMLAVSTVQSPGGTSETYDVNGYLVGHSDSTQANNSKTFVNDANGIALFVNQAGRVQRQLVVNGEVLGLYGAAVNPSDPASGNNNNPNFANLVDFDFGYSRISASYPTPAPGAYQVRAGDTLQSIAQGAYGDSALWYRIAEANGLQSSTDLKVGQTLNIPNRVSTISNNSTTFKPYDPSRIQGDLSPNMAMPQKDDCGALGKIIVVAVVVAVAVITQQYEIVQQGLTAAVDSMGEVMANTVGESILADIGAAVPGASMTAGAMGAAAGSFAGQVVGNGLGVQDGFSLKELALSAVSGGISGALAGVNFTNTALQSTSNVIVRAAVGNALTQGIGVVTGLQRRFDWRGVVASAAGAGVGSELHGALEARGTDGAAPFGGPTAAGRLVRSAISGLAAGGTAALMHGGRVSVQQVAMDAFGNALGQSIAESSNGAPARGQSEDPLGDLIAKNNNWAHVDVPPVAQQQRDALYGWSIDNDGLGFRPTTGVGTVGMRYQGVRSPMFDDTRVFSDSDDPNTLANVGQDGRPTAFMPVPPAAVGGVAGGGAAAAGGYEVVRPSGAGGAPGYDLVRDMPAGPPALLPASPSLGLGAPPQQAKEKPWFDRAIEGMPIGVKAAAGLMQLITTKVGEALGTTTPARGGTYVLKDEEGNVVRSGRTNDLARREKEHFRNPALSDYTFEEVHRTDDYREQRGLEHRLHETYNPALNKIRPINPSNPRMTVYLDAGDAYLRRQGK